MLKILLAMGLALSASGCGHRGRACERAIAHAMEVGKDDLPPGPDGPAKLRTAMLSHCETDQWSDEVTSCFLAAKTQAGLKRCLEKLSPDQQHSLMKELQEALAPFAEPAPPHARHAAGSAAAD